jgi:hypothetical protein
VTTGDVSTEKSEVFRRTERASAAFKDVTSVARRRMRRYVPPLPSQSAQKPARLRSRCAAATVGQENRTRKIPRMQTLAPAAQKPSRRESL